MTHKQLRDRTAEAMGFKPIKNLDGKQHAYQKPGTMEWVTNDTMSWIAQGMTMAQRTGFYGSQTMAGVSLEEAHKNWKRYEKGK